MNRLKQTFARLHEEKRCGLIAYVTCGDPDLETTVKIILALERAGADVVELGVPFSDPIADGAVIQEASFRSLQRGTTMRDVLDVAGEVRKRSALPLVVFSYVNPILKFGIEEFAAAAEARGVDAVLATDLPPEASVEFRSSMKKHGLGTIFLLSPTSSPTRIALVNRASNAFVYYVSTTGVTGTRRELDPQLEDRLKSLRALVSRPLVVGFGISAPEHYQALAASCDAIVVGSAIVRAIASGDRDGAPSRAAEVVRTILGNDVSRNSSSVTPA